MLIITYLFYFEKGFCKKKQISALFVIFHMYRRAKIRIFHK